MNVTTYPKEKLLKLYGVDLFAAISSSAMVSPFIAIVDRSIIENLNGKRPLIEGLKFGARTILSQPFQFAGSAQFRLVLGLYFATYSTANIVDTTCEQYGINQSTTSLYKFLATTIFNMGLCIYKDKEFTRMFGTASVIHSVPKLSYFMFAMRDALTIAASFTLPVYLANFLQTHDWISTKETARVTAQIVSPAAVQFFSTPIHLYALDLYNRPVVSQCMRFSLIKKEYVKSTFARVSRIGPAFGFGGVGNTYIRGLRSRV
ncbi:hypothetical protein K501DRAFT_201020 [Backusella circina FSU 941]|nr:hypothetical protein K501DRAFT_201020 [Backusella circina FSU 941]